MLYKGAKIDILFKNTKRYWPKFAMFLNANWPKCLGFIELSDTQFSSLLLILALVFIDHHITTNSVDFMNERPITNTAHHRNRPNQ